MFCNVHTTLGFDRCMKDVVHEVEMKIGIENIFAGFVMELDQKGTVSLNFVRWVLNLFGPDHIQKPWNCHGLFKEYLSQMGTPVKLFSMKDARFAIVLHHLG